MFYIKRNLNYILYTFFPLFGSKSTFFLKNGKFIRFLKYYLYIKKWLSALSRPNFLNAEYQLVTAKKNYFTVSG